MRVNVPAELLRLGYTLLRRLGGGSTAEVFEARHNETGRRLAIKVSRGDVPEAPLIISRMQTEWNVGRGLRHPHLVTILDGGTFSDGRAWLAMELLKGHDLLDELTAHGAMEANRAIHVVRQVCEALRVLHRRGAVHRDVKPENVFLQADGRFADHVKLIDLGILALPDDDPERAHDPTGRFIMGTPLYLAPEQARGLRPDPRTDLYAVGGVLFHMLAGRPPFVGDEPTEIVSRHVNEPVPRLGDVVSGLPKRLVSLVHRCLEKDRADRPVDAAEVIRELDAIARDQGGVYETGQVLRRAPMPDIPAMGHTGEWVRLGEDLERLVGMFWPQQPPDPVIEGLNHRRDMLKVLETAQLEADVRREGADIAARQRIEGRERLQRRARRHARALERHVGRQREAAAAVDAAEHDLDAHDDRFAQLVDRLRGAAADTVDLTPVGQFAIAEHEADEVLAERATLLEAVEAAREMERGAAEAVAELRAEEIDIQRAFADHELDEQEEGFLAEQAAAAAVDARSAAERDHERALLRLLVAYAHALHPQTTRAT